MTIAFVVQTYTDLDQVERLARTLSEGIRSAIIIIAHRGSTQEHCRLSRAQGVDHVVPSPGGRAQFGMIDGLISAMRWLEKEQKTYDWLFVLSGHDYPVRPLHELEAELESSKLDGYFHHFDALDPAAAMQWPMCWSQELVQQRYFFRYAALKENPTTLQRAVLKPIRAFLDNCSKKYRLHTSFGIMLGCRPPENPFGQDLRLCGGNYWMTISHKAARAIIDFVDERPDVVNYFRGTIAPEEAFIPTVLANDHDLRLSTSELRYVKFEKLSHGRIPELGRADLERVRASGCFIARKFNFRRDPELADILDAVALQKPERAIEPSAAAVLTGLVTGEGWEVERPAQPELARRMSEALTEG